MPIDRSEVEEHQQTQTVMQYQTLLGLLFDNPDSYFSEDEILEYVDRVDDILQVQLLIVRITGATDEFPVETVNVDGRPMYGLDTHAKEDPTDGNLGSLSLPGELDLSMVSNLLSDRIDER